jgi:hypothetical protein
MAEVPSVEELDELSTDELRQRAFDRAEDRHDVGFFWDLYNHVPGAETAAGEDASSGHITGSIAELVTGLREVMGREDVGELEPLFRARFIDYLRHPD